MRTVELDDLDGFTSRFLHVAIAHDPFMDPYVSDAGMIRTVFAWGHPVLKITGPGCVGHGWNPDDADKEPGEQRPPSWQWLGLDDAIEPEDLTRQREVVTQFLIDLGMVGQDYEDDYENLAGALGTRDEADQFNTFLEHLGEHDLPEWVDRLVTRVPLLPDEEA